MALAPSDRLARLAQLTNRERLEDACNVKLTRKNTLLLALLCEVEGDEPCDVVNDAVTLFLDEWAARYRQSERRS